MSLSRSWARRTCPRALSGSLLVAGAAYVLVGLAVSAAVPTDVLAESSGPLLVVFVSTNVAVLVLRRERTTTPHFRVWTPVPVLGVASCVVLATQQSAGTYVRAGLLVLVGLALSGLSRLTGTTGRAAEPSPDEAGAAAPADQGAPGVSP